jgi:hypothetical protein
MGKFLAIELEKKIPTDIPQLPSLIFPDSSLPFAVNEEFLKSLGKTVWNSRRNILVHPEGLLEEQVETWLNGIAKAISNATGRTTRKIWTAQFANSILKHPELRRKPDIILVKERLNPINWRNVDAVAEVTRRPNLHSDMKKTIDNKTYLMFITQHSRRFVPFLAICSDDIYFIISDRQGQAIATISYCKAGVYHALNFIRIIVALMFGDDETIGFDSTVEMDAQGEIKKIRAGDTNYSVHSTIHVVRGIVGRSTRVWSAFRVLENGEREAVIIKDGWIQEGRADAEKENLEIVQDIRGVPKLIWGGSVQAHLPAGNNQLNDDTTLFIRNLFSDRRGFRIHRRLVLSPVGENLSTFASLGELVAALRDVVVGMFMTNFIYHAYIL